MKYTIKEFSKIYDGFNIVSRCAIKYGTVIIITLFVCAVYYYIKSFISDDVFYNTMMYTDLLYSIKECMGSIYVLPMLYETLSLTAGSGR